METGVFNLEIYWTRLYSDEGMQFGLPIDCNLWAWNRGRLYGALITAN